MKIEYENEAEDKWYKWKGVKPPERTAHATEEEIRDILATRLKDHKCVWKQNGAEIYCDVADFEHGQRIGPNLRIAGVSPNGEPVLVPVGPILRSDVESA